MFYITSNKINLFFIIITSIVIKFVVAIFTILLTGGLNDTYDYSIYYQAIGNILHGVLPWANGVIFYYPPLSTMPMFISYIFGDFSSFVTSMEMLMIGCDIGISICVYYIGLKLYNDHTALISVF